MRISDWSQTCALPILVGNETQLSLRAELARGAARGVAHAVYVHLGIGIGIGILVDGEIYRGAHGAAGEIGFLPLVEDGEPPGFGSFEWAAGGADRKSTRLNSSH